MADDFDVVTIGIKEEPRKVVLVIMRAGTWRAIIPCARGQGSKVARVDARVIWGGEGDVKWPDSLRHALQPEKCVVPSP